MTFEKFKEKVGNAGRYMKAHWKGAFTIAAFIGTAVALPFFSIPLVSSLTLALAAKFTALGTYAVMAATASVVLATATFVSGLAASLVFGIARFANFVASKRAGQNEAATEESVQAPDATKTEAEATQAPEAKVAQAPEAPTAAKPTVDSRPVSIGKNPNSLLADKSTKSANEELTPTETHGKTL